MTFNQAIKGLFLIFFSISDVVLAQDLRERTYLYEVLDPQHREKPLVDGWADKRPQERINRGLIVQETPDGGVYLSWRLLNSDPEGVSFNVFRTDDNGKEIRLNKKPIVS